jgi:lipoprotein-anchoring transpeptidase ErfK/SrfK
MSRTGFVASGTRSSRVGASRRFQLTAASLLAGLLVLGGCGSSGSSGTSEAAGSTAAVVPSLSTVPAQIIDTPEGVVTTAKPVPTIAPGYSEYEAGTTVVAYLLKGEESVEVYTNATDTTPSQTISRINGRTLPFVALGNTPDRIRVLLPVRPNGSIGWIDRTKLDLRRNDYRIDINRETFTMQVFNRNAVVREIKIGIGDDETPTPEGVYYTLYAGKPKTPNTVYGAFVIGLSGFSEVLEDFKGGEARLGLHGTNRPDLLGEKVSKGCIRMADADVTYLVDTLPLGTPVHVTA